MENIDNRIKSLVRGLFEDKQAYKEIEASVNSATAELKKWMGEKKKDLLEVDNIKVTYACQNRSSMDEGKTIEILRQLATEADAETAEKILGCIKTKPYVDENELEALIYNEVVNKEALNPAVITKPVYVLTVRENKAKNKGKG